MSNQERRDEISFIYTCICLKCLFNYVFRYLHLFRPSSSSTTTSTSNIIIKHLFFPRTQTSQSQSSCSAGRDNTPREHTLLNTNHADIWSFDRIFHLLLLLSSILVMFSWYCLNLLFVYRFFLARCSSSDYYLANTGIKVTNSFLFSVNYPIWWFFFSCFHIWNQSIYSHVILLSIVDVQPNQVCLLTQIIF